MSEKRRWGDRKDGKLLRDIDAMHVIMPFLYVNRADNEAYISERIDLEPIKKYLAEKNAENPDDPYKLFQVIIAALVKTVVLRPKMNRFIQGSQLYQRNKLTMGFTLKKEFNDEAHEGLAYMEFDENSTMDSVHAKIVKEIHNVRHVEGSDNSTDQMDIFKKIPRPILRIVMWFMRKLDKYGKVPETLIKTDPNYATCFITNLGSIGLKCGYHHLSNWGTTSIFVIIGETKTSPHYDEDGNMTMRETVDIGLTIDERIADGYYYAKTVALLKHLLQNPQLLELPAKEKVEYAFKHKK